MAREPATLTRALLGRVGYRAAVVLAGAAALSACEKQSTSNPPSHTSSGEPVAVYGPPPMMKGDADAPAPTPQATDAGAPKK